VANSGTKLHGKNGAIYLGGAKGSGGVKVATKSEWTLQRNRDYVDATVFGDTNKTYLAGLPNIQGSFNGFLDVSGDLLLNAATSDSQTMYLYADDNPNSDTSEVLVAHGPALIDASVTVGNADGARISGDFRAQGAWTIDLGGV
jgi:hypothetical protein